MLLNRWEYNCPGIAHLTRILTLRKKSPRSERRPDCSSLSRLEGAITAQGLGHYGVDIGYNNVCRPLSVSHPTPGEKFSGWVFLKGAVVPAKGTDSSKVIYSRVILAQRSARPRRLSRNNTIRRLTKTRHKTSNKVADVGSDKPLRTQNTVLANRHHLPLLS